MPVQNFLSQTKRDTLKAQHKVDIISKKVLIQQDETLNAQSTISFLKKIEAAYPNAVKVHLFCENTRYYRNKDVKDCLGIL